MKDEELPVVPSVENILLQSPLYTIYQQGDTSLFDYIYNLVSFGETIDTYCLHCGKQSTYRGQYNRERNIPKGEYNQFLNPQNLITARGASHFVGRALMVELYCTRDSEHKMIFMFYATLNTLSKIGQQPSLADVTMPEIKKYQKVLAGDYKEFSRAIGLTTHGVGIGAFVYLRRIFENLIEEAHKIEALRADWAEEAYASARMADKITILKAQLPPFLVNNKSLYSILSKGIHELSEEECLKVFPAIKASIELILDQKLVRIAAAKKEKEAEEALAAIMKGIAS